MQGRRVVGLHQQSLCKAKYLTLFESSLILTSCPFDTPNPRPTSATPERDGSSAPLALHHRAQADLAFVRDTVARAAYFSAVPGVAGICMGATALVAALIASRQPDQTRWLAVWMIEAVLAAIIGATGIIRKAHRRRVPLGAAPALRFAFGLVPPLLAGGALTVASVQVNAWSLLPPIWMMCYGIAILAAGAVSQARAVPLLGAMFTVAGVACIALPTAWADANLALSFGLGHIIAGAHIARRHGG